MVQLLYGLAAPTMVLPPLAAYFVSYGMVVGLVLATCNAAPRLEGRRALWMLIPALLIVMLALFKIRADNAGLAALVLCGVLLGCSALGGLIGGKVEKAGYLLVVAIISASVDAYSVLTPEGITAQVVEDEALLSVLAISWPMAGVSELFPILGMGDVTLTALYFVAARRHGLGMGRGVIAFAVAYIAIAVCVVLAERALPALPFLGLAALVAWPEARRIPREDRAQAWGGMAVVAAALILVTLFR